MNRPTHRARGSAPTTRPFIEMTDDEIDPLALKAGRVMKANLAARWP